MKSFKISCWNIQGLHSSTFGNKSADQDLLSSVTDMDICIFHETWCCSNEALHCPIGYKEIIVPSLKKSQIKYGRDSGGILIWHKDNLKHLFKLLKLKMHLFGLKWNQSYHNIILPLCTLYSTSRLSLLQRAKLSTATDWHLALSVKRTCSHMWRLKCQDRKRNWLCKYPTTPRFILH